LHLNKHGAGARTHAHTHTHTHTWTYANTHTHTYTHTQTHTHKLTHTHGGEQWAHHNCSKHTTRWRKYTSCLKTWFTCALGSYPLPKSLSFLCFIHASKNICKTLLTLRGMRWRCNRNRHQTKPFCTDRYLVTLA
jgi:hypothetical protein